MAKLKAGEWFQFTTFDGLAVPALLVSTRPDYKGHTNLSVTFRRDDGSWNNTWQTLDELSTQPRLNRQRWVHFRRAKRADNNVFHAIHSPNGRLARIVAGCRSFTIAEAKEHWGSRDRSWLRRHPNDCAYTNAELNDFALRFIAKFEMHLRAVRAGKVA